LESFFEKTDISILIAIWVFSGSLFGCIMSYLINTYVAKSGKLSLYDRISKFILLIGILGYVLIGVCYQFKVDSFAGYAILMIFIGIGSIGYYGLMFLSMI
jgi:hypothetical protein